jgi:Mrp family chromosome partitioning ATPase
MPPVLAVSDAAPFFGRLDGVLLLARAGRAPLGVYRGALEQIERLGGKVLGTIFNGFDARRSGRGYGYGYTYGGYYGYGYRSYYGTEEKGKRKKRAEEPEMESAGKGSSSRD